MLKRGRILTEDEARAKVRLWKNKAIHREAEEKRSRCPAVASDNGVTTVGDGVSACKRLRCCGLVYFSEPGGTASLSASI